MGDIRDRIVDLRRVKASELRRNPHNFWEHTPEQRSALRGILAEVGFAGALLVRETADGELELIDGELRADEFGDQEVPVLIVDVSEAEAKVLLATYDGIKGMAQIAAERYRALLGDLRPEDADLRRFVASSMPGELDGMGQQHGQEGGPSGMELVPHEHYDYMIVLARTVHQWNRLADLVGFSTAGGSRGRIGIGRGLEASKLIELLEDGNVSNRRTKPASDPEHEKGSGAPA